MFAIEFHYFSDGRKHLPCQGSLTADTFMEILAYLDHHFDLMRARDFYETALAGEGTEKQVCLTFDDGISSQWDVAVPCLERAGITGMFFCYSAHYAGKPSLLEIYHDFRFCCFKSVDEFYSQFFQLLLQDPHVATPDIADRIQSFTYDSYLINCPWHSYSDKLFRYTRDQLLSEVQFEKIMMGMMESKGYSWKEKVAELWMSKENLRALSRSGHMIGLHSHSHPTNIDRLPLAIQRQEYETNAEYLEHILGHPVKIAAFPCGKYNADTQKILQKLGIRLAFSADMNKGADLMRMPRMNHPLLMKEMKKQTNNFD